MPVSDVPLHVYMFLKAKVGIVSSASADGASPRSFCVVLGMIDPPAPTMLSY